MASIQAAKSGYLCSEPMGWSKLWFVVLNKFLFQFADNNSPQPQCGMPLAGTSVQLEPVYSRPHCFSRCAAGVVVLAADSDQDARDWVDAINRDIAGTPVAVAVQPQQVPQVQPQAQLPTPQAQPQAQAQPQPQQVPQQMQQQQQMQQMQPQQQVPQPQTANELSPETFWANSFGKLEEVPWAQLVDELSGALGVSLRNSEYYGPVYCIANVVAEGSLTTQNAISRTNFRLFVALFGPLSQCHIKCKDLIDAGIFHGEITSQEADDRLRAADAVGGYLVRLRKGSRHQVALAFMDSQKMCKHILLDVNQNMYCIHQLPQAFATIPKLVQAYRTKFTHPVAWRLMDHYGPNSTALAPQTAVSTAGPAAGAAAAGAAPGSAEAAAPQEDTPKLTVAEAEAAIAAATSEAEAEAAAAGAPTIPPGATAEAMIVRCTQLMSEIEVTKQHILALARAERPFAVDPSVVSGPSNAGYLQQVLLKQKPTIVVNVRVPVLELERKMALPGTCVRKDALDRILRRASVQNMEQLGLYLPDTGVWTADDRALSSYLLVNEDKIDVLFRPQQANPCVVAVHNQLTGAVEHVPIDDHTTIFGMIQAVAKPDAARTAQSGIRIRTAAGSFFCDPTRLCTDYQVGLAIKSVEYGVVAAGEQFVQPKYAPLDQAPVLAAARASRTATVPALRRLARDLADAQRVFHVLKTRSADPSVASATASATASPASGGATAAGASDNGTEKTTTTDGANDFGVDWTAALAETAYAGLGPLLQADETPACALVAEAPAVPATAAVRGGTLYGTVLDVPADVPPADGATAALTRWLADAAYVGAWWAALSAAQRREPAAVARARTLVRTLFAADPADPATAQRMALVHAGTLAPALLAGLTQCLSDVAAAAASH